MKSSTGSSLLALSLLASTVSSQLVLPAFLAPRKPSPAAQGQQPIMSVPNIVMPPSNNNNDDGDGDGPSAGPLRISDVIGKERAINIFAGFTRDIDSISKRLDSGSENTTLLAPLNPVLVKLPRKPWEDPQEYDALGANAYEGNGGVDRAHRNLKRFVEAHIVPVSPWKENDKVRTLDGGQIWYELKDGKKMIQPGDIEVESVPSRVANGELWMLKGIINYSR